MFLTTRVLTSAFTRMRPGEDISVVCCERSRGAVLCRQPNKQDLFRKYTWSWVPTSTNSYQLSTIVIQSLLIPTNLASVLIQAVQSVTETVGLTHFCQSPLKFSTTMENDSRWRRYRGIQTWDSCCRGHDGKQGNLSWLFLRTNITIDLSQYITLFGGIFQANLSFFPWVWALFNVVDLIAVITKEKRSYPGNESLLKTAGESCPRIFFFEDYLIIGN